MTGCPRWRRERNEPPGLRLRRQSLPTGPSRSRDKKKTLSSTVSVVGRSRSDGGPVPSGTNGSEHHRSRSGDRGRGGHGSERRHDSPRSSHSSRRRKSGERTQPTSSGGSSSRARHTDHDLTDAPGSGRASGRATEVRPSSSATHHRHRSRSSPDRRSRSGSRHHDRRESVDSVRSGSSYLSRCEVQLFPAAPQQMEKRTITVIPSSQTSADGRLGRRDGPGRLGRGTRLSRVWVSRGSRISVRQWRSRRLFTTQQLWPTRHRIRTQQVPTQHTHRIQQVTTQHILRTQQVTTWQGVTGRRPRVPRQALRQCQDKTHPWFLMSAVWCFHLCRETSTRLTSCQCGLSWNEGWTRVWQFQIPNPGPLTRHRRPDRIILHLEELGLQSGVPGLQTDDLGLQSGMPEGWTSPETPLVRDLPLEDLLPQNLAPGMLHQSTFLQPWTRKRKSRTGLSLKMKVTRDLRRKSQQHNTSCSARLWLHLRARSRLTLRSLAGLPGHLWWI